MLGAGAGAGAVRCRVLALAVHVVETRHAVLRIKIGAAANAGCSPEKSLACFCYLGSTLEQFFPALIKLRCSQQFARGLG